VILDSVGAAATADLEKAQAVVQVFRGLRSLNPGGLLLIDHQSKLQAGQDYRDKTPFGSVYKYNLSRVIWQSELVESQPGEAWVVIRNVKNNLGPLQGEIGVKLSFEEGWVTVTTVALTSSPLVERASLETRIIAALGERGPSTAQEIADHLEANPKSVKAKLSRLKGLGRVVVTGTVGREHLWSLPGTTEHSPDDQGESSLTALTDNTVVNVNDDPEKHHTPHHDAKNGEQTPAGEDEKHHTWLPDAKNGEHDPAGEAEKHHTWLHDAKTAVCEVCGQLFTWSGRGQPARYCSRTCQMKAYRQRQSSADTPGHGEPVSTAVVQADSGPPDPGICLDCHQPITAEGFQYRCPACLKARYDRLGREYPEKLVRWLQTHDQKEGR
jgi:hypothetical protein